MNLLKRLLDHEYKELKRFSEIADKIEELDPVMQSKTDEELRQYTQIFKDRLKNGETLDDTLVEGQRIAVYINLAFLVRIVSVGGVVDAAVGSGATEHNLQVLHLGCGLRYLESVLFINGHLGVELARLGGYHLIGQVTDQLDGGLILRAQCRRHRPVCSVVELLFAVTAA